MRIIFHFFRFYYSEMRRKLWPAKEGALGQMWKNCQVYFIHINFFKKPNEKNIHWSQKVILQCYYISFLILHCLLAQIKWKLKSGPRLPTLPWIWFFFPNRKLKIHNARLKVFSSRFLKRIYIQNYRRKIHWTWTWTLFLCFL